MKTSLLIARGRRVLSIEAGPSPRSNIGSTSHSRAACELLLACAGPRRRHGHGQVGAHRQQDRRDTRQHRQPRVFPAPGRGDARRRRHDHGARTSCSRFRIPARPTNCSTILPIIKRLDVPLIALTRQDAARPCRATRRVTLDVSVPAEACPLNLAPTASTTATLAMGDALAIAVLEARGFTPRILRARIPAARWDGVC